MKKFVFNILFFSVSFVMLYPFMLFLWGLYMPDNFKKNVENVDKGLLTLKKNELSHFKNVDYWVLGSSHAYRGYDPRVFAQYGLKMVNWGSSAQNAVQSEWIFDKYIDSIKPKKIILDIYPLMLNHENLLPYLDFWMNDITSTFPLTKINYSNINEVNTSIFTFLKKKMNVSTFNDASLRGTYIKGGYVESNQKFKKQVEDYKTKNYKILPLHAQAIERIVQKCKDRNIKLYMIQSPVTKPHYEIVLNNKEINEYFSTFGNYYNFNQTLSLTNDFFFDNNHLNQKGVEVFNRRLIEVLE
jgi:hypothetical protein